tara:strand:+ start:154 stop:678 length:525 start_codon:yes stop_codon:yes gene_type:complete
MQRFTGVFIVNSLLVLINLGVAGYSGYIIYEERKDNNDLSWKNCDSMLIYSAICGIAAFLYGLNRIYETLYILRKRRVLRNRLSSPRRYWRGANMLMLFGISVLYIGFHSVLCIRLRNLNSDCVHYFKRNVSNVGNTWGLFITQVTNFLIFVTTGLYLVKQSMCPTRTMYDDIY